MELGRYNQTTTNNRHCPLCGPNQTKDEVHFLFHCSIYSMIMKTEFLQESQVSDICYDQWTDELLFIHRQCIKHISACFDFCDKWLTK